MNKSEEHQTDLRKVFRLKYLKDTSINLDIEDATSYKDAGDKFLDKVNVADIQISSFEKFIKEVVPYYLSRVYSYGNGTRIIKFSDWYLDYSKTNTEEYCRNNKTTYKADLKGTISLTINLPNTDESNNDKRQFTFTKKIVIEQIPLLTKNGSIIVNGRDRTLVGHLEDNNSVRLGELVSAKEKLKILDFKSSFRKLKTKSNGTTPKSFHLETNGKDIIFKLDGLVNSAKNKKGNPLPLSPIALLAEHLHLSSTLDYQYILGNSPDMMNALNKYNSSSNVVGSQASEGTDLLGALDKFNLKYGERQGLNKRLSLTNRALGLTSYEDILNPLSTSEEDKYLCRKDEILEANVLDQLQTLGKDVIVYSIVDGVSPVKIISNKFALADDIIKTTKIFETVPEILTGKTISTTILEELIETSKVETMPLIDLIKLNMDKLIGSSMCFDDYVSLLNLFGQLLAKEVEPEDKTSLETKSLISIAEIYEEQFMKKFLPGNGYDKIFIDSNRNQSSDKYKERLLLEKLAVGNQSKFPDHDIIRVIPSHKLFNIEDTASPFSQVSMKGKISQQQVEGRGGVPGKSSNVDIRTVNPSFMGRIDLQETSEGENVGLVRYLAHQAKIDVDGSILAPFFLLEEEDKRRKKINYKKVYYIKYETEKLLNRAISPDIALRDEVVIEFYKNEDGKIMQKIDKVTYPTSYTDEGELIDTTDYKQVAKDIIAEKYNNDTNITYKVLYYKKDWFKDEDNILAFSGHGNIKETNYKNIDLVSVRSDHLLSLSSASTPFVQHNDSTRQMMGNNHAKQAIALYNAVEPYIVSEVSSKISQNVAGTIFAPISGTVKRVEADRIIIQPFDDTAEKVEVTLPRYFETSVNTHMFSIPLVEPNDIVLEGDQIARNNMTSKSGQIAHGVTLCIAIMPYEGRNFEDSIILSDRVLEENLFTSLHLKEYRFEVNTHSTFTHPKTNAQILKEIPYHFDIDSSLISNKMSEEMKRTINSETGLIISNSVIEPNQPLLVTYKLDGKVMSLAQDVKYHLHTYTYDGHTSGRVVHCRREETKNGFTYIIKVVSKEEINAGDKISGRHGNKGVVSTIMRKEDMPFDQETGQRADIIFNPLGIPSRMNLGQLFETHLTPMLKAYGLRVELIPNDKVDVEMFKQMISFRKDEDGNPTTKVQLCDGRTGEPFDGLTTMGLAYFLKAKHLVDHKFAVRSFGHYDTIYNQPPQGKKSGGGQRLGNMELWSLAEHGVNNVLFELLKLKSDDPIGRSALKKYLSQNKQNIENDEYYSADADELLKQVNETQNVSHTQKLVYAMLMASYVYPKHITKDGKEINPFINVYSINQIGKDKNGKTEYINPIDNDVIRTRDNSIYRITNETMPYQSKEMPKIAARVSSNIQREKSTKQNITNEFNDINDLL